MTTAETPEVSASPAKQSTPKSSFSDGENVSTRPPWLLTSLSEMEERLKSLTIKTGEEDVGDTLAQRAESYYRKRPQLLGLLQDLYNAYVRLSDRYVQTASRIHHLYHHGHSSLKPLYVGGDNCACYQEQDGIGSSIDSDAESSLSYQQPPATFSETDAIRFTGETDLILAELVMKSVEYDILVDEICVTDRQLNESGKKTELQKSLLEVLESERLILLNENARLGYRVAALVEENRGLVSESVFMKRKAGEMARCLFKMREDQRVCMLSHKIEDLQGQIYWLEKRNRDYYEQLAVKGDKENKCCSCTREKNKNENESGKEVGLEVCFQIRKLKVKAEKKRDESGKKGYRSWWDRVKKMDLSLCGQAPFCT